MISPSVSVVIVRISPLFLEKLELSCHSCRCRHSRRRRRRYHHRLVDFACGYALPLHFYCSSRQEGTISHASVRRRDDVHRVRQGFSRETRCVRRGKVVAETRQRRNPCGDASGQKVFAETRQREKSHPSVVWKTLLAPSQCTMYMFMPCAFTFRW